MLSVIIYPEFGQCEIYIYIIFCSTLEHVLDCRTPVSLMVLFVTSCVCRFCDRNRVHESNNSWLYSLDHRTSLLKGPMLKRNVPFGVWQSLSLPERWGCRLVDTFDAPSNSHWQVQLPNGSAGTTSISHTWRGHDVQTLSTEKKGVWAKALYSIQVVQKHVWPTS